MNKIAIFIQVFNEKFKIDLIDIEFPSNRGILSTIYEGRKGDDVFHIRIIT